LNGLKPGVLFRLLPDGSEFSRLIEFSQDSTGKNPFGTLFLHDSVLYVTTQNSGFYDKGTLVSIRVDGLGFMKLLDFDDIQYPSECVLYTFNEGYLYGTSPHGGSKDKG